MKKNAAKRVRRIDVIAGIYFFSMTTWFLASWVEIGMHSLEKGYVYSAWNLIVMLFH